MSFPRLVINKGIFLLGAHALPLALRSLALRETSSQVVSMLWLLAKSKQRTEAKKSLEADSLRPLLSLEMTTTACLPPAGRPWARNAQQSHSSIPDLRNYVTVTFVVLNC